MNILNTIKIGSFGILGSFILMLWFFGGTIGCIIGIIKNEAIFAVASLLVPGFGAIYSVLSIIGGIFGAIF